ncbi:MAG: dienelactone hydrolase family protein [Candidatus Binatia bacterium]|nr:dienelactone hydrolase family protein [Candidatus Binatia bacterium]
MGCSTARDAALPIPVHGEGGQAARLEEGAARKRASGGGVRGEERADHFQDVRGPMLFLQGTRDSLADLDSIKGIAKGLGKRGKIHVVEGGGHSFHVLKRSGRADEEALDELAEPIAFFVAV